MESFDVLIIGAGAAGMMAALELALTGKKVAVIEAHQRCGGRMKTIPTASGDVMELGAEFVHGNLSLTKSLARKAGAEMYEVGGSILHHHNGGLHQQKDFIEDYDKLEKAWKNLATDLSVKEFLENHLAGSENEELRFSLQNYVEGYYAADTEKASLFALREELTKGDEEQYRLIGGYQTIVNYLEHSCREKGVQFFFGQPVLQLHWRTNHVEAITATNSYTAAKAIVTVSIGVLQKESITFSPALPQKMAAAKKLGFGHVVKTNFLFEKPFWTRKELTGGKDVSDFGFLFSEEEIPTWWTHHPKKTPLLAGWRGGPKAKALSLLADEQLYSKSLHAMSNIFGIDNIQLNQLLVEKGFYNWSADPYFEGAYSYAVINGAASLNEILQPVDSTIYFAGEGLHAGPEIGTVEAALQSGRSVAHNVVAAF